MVVVIYGTPACTYCNQAKKMCDLNDIEYSYVDLTSDPDAMAAVTAEIGNFRTVPQIRVDGTIIGGFNELRNKIMEL